jgi:sugar lactone lactonase YvrE
MRHLSVALALALLLGTGFAGAADTESAEPAMAPTHEASGTIAIPMGDQKLAIHTFCVDKKGNLLAACGGERMTYVRTESGYQTKMVAEPSCIRVVGPEGKEIATWPLEITPQAVNVGDDGSIYCGGQGRICKLGPDGKVLLTAESPQCAELGPLPSGEAPPAKKLSPEEEKAKQERIEAIKKQQKEVSLKLRELHKQRSAKDIDEKTKAGLEAEFEKILATYRALYTELRALTTDPQKIAMQERSAALRKRAVTGIGVTGSDVFVACPATKGYGYDVWRMTADLKDPKKIVTGLRGCCGQMDIQAAAGKLYVAENSRFRVVCYDRDGKQLASWGKGDRKSVEGFGSCCNPMNVRVGPDGNVYTSESNVGRIKRYSPDGKLLGVVGTSTIVPGCKHVAIGMNKDLSRVYMLDITRTNIIVMAKK